jgi:hypothetical protein
MCPFCLGTMAWIAAGVLSTGGISALAVSTLRGRHHDTTTNDKH